MGVCLILLRGRLESPDTWYPLGALDGIVLPRYNLLRSLIHALSISLCH